MTTDLNNEYSGSESDGSEEEKENSISVPHKRRRFSDDERRTRCRERNKIHARNTRERKRVQMETLQQNIQDLIDEKVRLTNMLPDSSIASILMSLNQSNDGEGLLGADSYKESSGESLSEAMIQQENEISKEVRRRANLTIEKLRLQVSALLNVDEELDISQLSNGNSLLNEKDRSKFTKAELGQIRRERNRLHAKKTRLKKKKMLAEMELIISGLQEEINVLKGETANISSSAINTSSASYFMPVLSGSTFASAPQPKISSFPSSEGMTARSNLNFADLGFSRSNSSFLQYYNPQLAMTGSGSGGSATFPGSQSYFGAESSLFGPFVDVARTVAAMSAYSDHQTNSDAVTTTTSSSNHSNSPGGYQSQHLGRSNHQEQSQDSVGQSRCGSDMTDGSSKFNGLHIDTKRCYNVSGMNEYENSPLALILAASSIREGSSDRTSKSETGSTADSNNERDTEGSCSGAEKAAAAGGRSPRSNSVATDSHTSGSGSSDENGMAEREVAGGRSTSIALNNHNQGEYRSSEFCVSKATNESRIAAFVGSG